MSEKGAGNGLPSLPDGWEWKRISDIAATSSGGTPNSKTPEYYGGDIPWLKIGDLNDGEVKESQQSLTQAGFDASAAKRVPPGTLLVAMYGSIGKLGILRIEATTNQAICAVQPSSQISVEYLYWVLRYQRPALNRIGRGGTQRNISQGDLKDWRVPLPPRREQDRIVAALEEEIARADSIFAELDALDRLEAQFCRAVLRDAVIGRLGKADDESEDFDVTDSDGTPVLPEGWEWRPIGDLGEVQLGRQRAPKYHDGPNMRPYLRVKNVFEDRLDLSDVMEMEFGASDFATYQLDDGDILLNEGQSPELVGRPAMYRGELPGVCFTNSLIRFRAGDRLDREYALLAFRAMLHSGRFRKEARITTNIAHLSAGRFATIEMPVPPVAVQNEIVRVAEEEMDRAARLRSAVKEARRDLGRMKHSIMHSAITGRLVGSRNGDAG